MLCAMAMLCALAAPRQETANRDVEIWRGEAQILSGQDQSPQRKLSKQTPSLMSMSQAIIISCVT